MEQVKNSLFVCPCCGQNTLEEDYEDSYEICPECGWEREYAYELHPDKVLGFSNGDISLNMARAYWNRYHRQIPYEFFNQSQFPNLKWDL